MKILFGLAFLFLFSVCVFPQSRTEKEVSATINAWADSILKRDMTALGKILADDIIITDYTGKTRGKTEELEVLKPMPHVKTISVENEDVKIRIYGKSAVVTAMTKMKFNIAGWIRVWRCATPLFLLNGTGAGRSSRCRQRG
jgi:ketosteroid isomerase-like protein